jgi:hypothetical protein
MTEYAVADNRLIDRFGRQVTYLRISVDSTACVTSR